MASYKILIVEDELLVATDIQESLEMLGYTVIDSVATGADAIQSVNRELPDVILMDIMLRGEMTGIEAAQAINRQHDVPIIYLTANADPATIDKAKFSLPYGYIIKPFTDKDLQTNIEIARFKFMNDLKAKMESDQYNRFFQKVANHGDVIFVDGSNGLEKVHPGLIYYVEGDDTQSVIYTFDGEISLEKSIDEIQNLLPAELFVKVSERHLVNIQKIFLVKFPEVIVADRMSVLIADADKEHALVKAAGQKN
jgi:CheY-like chemotaxis protein